MTTLAECNSKISEIVYILKSEAKALRVGDLSGVEEYMTQKTQKLAELDALMKSLSGQPALRELAPQFAWLKQASTDNGLILKSVFNGMKSAHDRVAAIKNQGAEVGAYGRAGSNLYFHEEATMNEKTL